jgi:hypothetical protein
MVDQHAIDNASSSKRHHFGSAFHLPLEEADENLLAKSWKRISSHDGGVDVGEQV